MDCAKKDFIDCTEDGLHCNKVVRFISIAV